MHPLLAPGNSRLRRPSWCGCLCCRPQCRTPQSWSSRRCPKQRHWCYSRTVMQFTKKLWQCFGLLLIDDHYKWFCYTFSKKERPYFLLLSDFIALKLGKNLILGHFSQPSKGTFSVKIQYYTKKTFKERGHLSYPSSLMISKRHLTLIKRGVYCQYNNNNRRLGPSEEWAPGRRHTFIQYTCQSAIISKTIKLW